MFEQNTVLQGDCLEILSKINEPFADLIFADPPYNIGYGYDHYDDSKNQELYIEWTRKWMTACAKVLKPTGSFWITIGAEYAADVRIIARELGLEMRNWIIWHYSFGQNATNKFSRSHAHIFYFIKDPENFVFNDQAVRTFSDRERIYKDKRAKLIGRMPYDVWSEFPRICGSFAERQGWHPCQMPESILARILRVCSNPGQLIFDPFAGSGTTLAVAKRFSRNYFGCELSANYVSGIADRLAETPKLEDELTHDENWPVIQIQMLKNAYREYCVPVATLEKSPEMMKRFTLRFNTRVAHSMAKPMEFTSEEIMVQFCKLRLAHKLPKIRVYFKESIKQVEI